MARSIDITQWHDRTEEPAIVCVYDGFVYLAPVAVDDGHENDLYQEYATAFFAAHAYMTREELEEEYAEDYTPEEIDDIYATDRASLAGLPAEWYAEGTEEDGSDTIMYVAEETLCNSHRETLAEATPYLDPEDVARIYRAILDARAEYDA